MTEGAEYHRQRASQHRRQAERMAAEAYKSLHLQLAALHEAAAAEGGHRLRFVSEERR